MNRWNWDEPLTIPGDVPMMLTCPNCNRIRVVLPQEQAAIVAELKARGPAVRKILECGAYSRGQWGICLAREGRMSGNGWT